MIGLMPFVSDTGTTWQALSGPMAQILDRLRMFGEFEVRFSYALPCSLGAVVVGGQQC